MSTPLHAGHNVASSTAYVSRSTVSWQGSLGISPHPIHHEHGVAALVDHARDDVAGRSVGHSKDNVARIEPNMPRVSLRQQKRVDVCPLGPHIADQFNVTVIL